MTIWHTPKHTSFQETPHGEFIEHWGGIDQKHDLSKSEVQNFLFRKFIAIRTKDQAKTWVATFGCPWGYSSLGWYAPDDVLNLARSLQWTHYFFQLLKFEQVPFVRKHLRVQRKIDREASKITEEEWHQIVHRIESGDPEMHDMVTWLSITRSAEKPEHGFVTFSRLSDYSSEIFFVDKTFGSDSSPMEASITQVEIESQNTALFEQDKSLLLGGYLYLQKVLELKIGNLTPGIAIFKNKIPHERFSLREVFRTETPWQAMLSELLKRTTSTSAPRKCANQACTRLFIPSRSDQIFCKQAACRQTVSRRRRKSGKP